MFSNGALFRRVSGRWLCVSGSAAGAADPDRSQVACAGPGLAAGLPGTAALRLSGRHSPGQWGQQGSASGDRSVGRGMAAVLMS